MTNPYAPQNPCLPMVVSAFVLNEAVASDPDARIAPITQPNYSFLRLAEDIVQNDAQDSTDLHYTYPATNNPRLYDIGRNVRLDRRIGTYVSWTLPKLYRSGVAATPNSQGGTDADKDQARQQKGLPPVSSQERSGAGTFQGDYSSPDFRFVPTRWLVVRLIDKSSIANLPAAIADKLEFTAWIVDSDLNDELALLKQAEIFMGRCIDYESWNEASAGDMRSRPQLSVLNAANPIFADFQPHNSNVFSIVDNFNYTDQNGKTAILQSATASYYVIGWHSKEEEDPFYMTTAAIQAKQTLQTRLNNLSIDLPNPVKDKTISDWLCFIGSARSVCHGAIYNVQWTYDKMPPSPAQLTGQYLSKTTNQPVAIGTTPTDTVLSYVHAHMNLDPKDLVRLEKDVWNLGTLLLAQDDGVDKKAEAEDMLYSYNFERVYSGKKWHLTGSDSHPGQMPNTDQVETLRRLNYTQEVLDKALRTEKQLKWTLFSEWWKYVSAQEKIYDVHKVRKVSQNNLTDIITRLNTLRGRTDAKYPDKVCINSLQAEVDTLKTQIPTKTKGQEASAEPFYTRKDPTLLLGGIAAGWPEDYLNKLKIRLSSQVTFKIDEKCHRFQTAVAAIVAKLPGNTSGISAAVPSLLNEFFSFSGATPPDPGPTDVVPLYHDHGPLATSTGPLRDQWSGTQPWWPLFLEWQAEYFHIPYADWELAPTDASTWEYQVKGAPNPPLWLQSGIDKRTISGRMLMLPQPSFSLGTAIQRLENNLGPKLPVAPDEIDFLLAHLPSIPYLSSPMSGLTDHLVTLCRGTHIKPSQRPAGTQATTMAAALTSVKDLTNEQTHEPFTSKQLGLIGQESQQTPYGDLVRLSDNSTASPFKPATHGQMRFTQINVIDKFGQSVCVLNPDPVPDDKTPHIKPIVSDVYAPQQYVDANSGIPAQPNVVDRKMPNLSDNEFVQLPPGINQDSRLNFDFMFHNVHSPEEQVPNNYWEPCGDYDTPIWGWVLLNYVDYGLQFFDANGNFYREVRLGGLNGDVISSPWKPFGPPKTHTVDTKRLDDLLAVFTTQDTGPPYLAQFFQMIELALSKPNPTPSAFASYLQNVIGKPFALTTFGMSLELSTDAYVNQASAPSDLSPMTLLPPTDASQTQYQFPIKIGDAERPYDGLVGYWNTGLDSPGDTDFSNLYTYFTQPPNPPSSKTLAAHTAAAAPTTVEIALENLPRLSPFFTSPDVTTNTTPGSQIFAPQLVETVIGSNLSHYSIFAGIVDPFVALHAYPGILPVSSLQLPHWTIAKAMDNMTAFFHYGPLLVTQDVPQVFDPHYSTINETEKVDETDAVAIPSLKNAKWAWLQPFEVLPTEEEGDEGAECGGEEGAVKKEALGGTDPVADKFTQYMALGVTPSDEKPRYEAGPYTAIEGYLQLLEPLMKAETTGS
ncbi:hypothetical protein DPSP01_014261 [Paraphaeosphaeria sporulosa]